MMNKKRKTMKEYMGGGYMKPMQYQTGGPALPTTNLPLSIRRQLFDLNLDREISKAQEDQIEQAKALEKQEKRRGLFGTLGSLGGTALGTLAATALAGATGGLSLLAIPAVAKGLGSAAGSFAGEKLAEGITDTSSVGKRSSTGLLGSGFERLKDISKEASEGALGRSLATGFRTGLMTGGKDFGQKLLDKSPRLLGDFGARTYGLGGSDFAREVTEQGMQDNPFLEEMFGDIGEFSMPSPESTPSLESISSPLTAGIGNVDLSSFLEQARNYRDAARMQRETAERYGRLIDSQAFFNKGGMAKKKNYGYEKGGEMKMYAGGGLINMLPFNRRIM